MFLSTTVGFYSFLLTAMVAVDPHIHPDDIVSISCPKQDACYALDAAGNLFFSTDNGMVLKPAVKYQRIDKTKGVPRDNH